MKDPMQNNEELHDAWHLFFKELEEWRKRMDWYINRIYTLQEEVDKDNNKENNDV